MPELKMINGDPEVFWVERAVAELRSGRWIEVHDENEALLLAIVDSDPRRLLDRLSPLAAPDLSLVISADRAAMLGLAGASGQAVVFKISLGVDSAWVERLAFEAMLAPSNAVQFASGPASALAEASLQLAKHGGMAPAVLACKVVDRDKEMVDAQIDAGILVSVSLRHIEAFPARSARRLKRVADASVPLFGSEEARFVVFTQPGVALEHLAVIVGQPLLGGPVLVRLHSACLTGDLFASLRCDCGEQLHSALGAIAAAGSGVILYLAQEGRGIGLGNKMRAYRIQDQGFDTIEADRLLGFTADERRYDMAAHILMELGIDAIRLMTNNPEKVAALEAAGITVAERVPLIASTNRHNERYLAVKAAKAGHILDG